MYKIDGKQYTYLIKTDGSVINKKSAHAFRMRKIKNNGKSTSLFKTVTFNTLIEDSRDAESYVMIQALQYMKENNLKNAILRTDCKSFVDMVYNQVKVGRNSNQYKNKEYKSSRLGKDIQMLRTLLKATDSVLQYVGREYNTGADRLCDVSRDNGNFYVKGLKLRGFHRDRKKLQKQKLKGAN